MPRFFRREKNCEHALGTLNTISALAIAVGFSTGCSSESNAAGGASPSESGSSAGGAGGSAKGLPPETTDVVVYGATSGGVVAAIQISRMGKRVVLIEPTQHVGGLTASGLGATDWGNWNTITGLSNEFYRHIYTHYRQEDAWKRETAEEYAERANNDFSSSRFGGRWMWFEPHIAERTYETMLAEAGVEPIFGERLDLTDGVKKEGARIVSVKMESGRQFEADMFIDTSYEGDLMALAGVSYTVGRESQDKYGEPIAGNQPSQNWGHNFEHDVDPYVTPGDPDSGLVPGITSDGVLPVGEGDHRLQAYNFRMCLTNDPNNRVDIEEPEGYDAWEYELLGRYYAAGYDEGPATMETQKYIHVAMPNKKTDTNNRGVFSTDYVGANYDYPDGDYATRERIVKGHERYQKGLMWFLKTDPRVPENVKLATKTWGLAKDEFVDNNHWPHQLYIREARRMVSDYVMTYANAQSEEVVDDPVALASYPADSHNVRRYVDSTGVAKAEGFFIVAVKEPFPISYRSIVPKREEAENLFVTFALSASHVAFGSIRMEPVFMMTSQSAATAAVIAIDGNIAAQEVDYANLSAELKAGGLRLP